MHITTPEMLIILSQAVLTWLLPSIVLLVAIYFVVRKAVKDQINKMR